MTTQVNPPPHFISLLVVFVGYAQTVATPLLIFLLYGRISDALAVGLRRLTRAKRSPRSKSSGATTLSGSSATPKTSLSQAPARLSDISAT